MDTKTLIGILETNKFMHSNLEIAAFENALAELAKNRPTQYLPELHLVGSFGVAMLLFT